MSSFLFSQERHIIIPKHYININDSIIELALREKSSNALNYWSIGKLDMSMIEYHKMLRIAEYFNKKEAQAMALNNIGFLYAEFNNYDRCIAYYKKALEIRYETEDKRGVGLSLNNIGKFYHNIDSLEISLHYFEKSLDISKEVKDTMLEGNVLNNIGNLYLDLGNSNNAMQYHQEALFLRKITYDKRGIIESYKNIADLYLKTHDFTKAKEIIDKGLILSAQTKNKKQLKNFYYLLYELHAKTKDYQAALEYYITYNNINDSILSSKSKDKFAELEILYQTDKKEQQIQFLKVKDQLKKKKIESKNLIIKFVGTLSVILALLFLILSRMYNQKRKALNILVRYNLEALKREHNSKQHKTQSNTNLNDDKQKIILNNIEKCMEKEKPYLDINFSIEIFAKKINSNRQYISQIINQAFEKNFSTYVNEYRIKEARKLLADDLNNKYTIEAISKMVGFYSRTSFISAFKKYTGVTPSYFKNNKDNIDSMN